MISNEVIFILFIYVLCANCQVFDISTFINQLVESVSPPLPNNEQHVEDTTLFQEEYDFIIIGAGSAGSVMANRLTEISQWSVLLLEAGKDEIFFTDIPLFAPILAYTGYDWGYFTEKSDKHCLATHGGGRCKWPRGKGLGGSSTTNFMVYTRGNKRDYDRWANEGNTGWSYEEVLPYFLKSEKNRIKEHIGSPYHSSKGLLNVEYCPYTTPLLKSFLEAGKEFGYNITDPNGLQNVGFSRIQANIRNGKRCSTAKAFLRPIRKRKNLFIAQKARVTKILIDPITKIATGVEFIKDRIKRTVSAKKEVILSAGTLNSPQLLMLSGIGPEEHLNELDIPVLRNLPVGYNLQDHISVAGVIYLVNQTVSVNQHRLENIVTVLQYVSGKGPLTVPGAAEGIAFVKTKYDKDPDPDYPDLEIVLAVSAINVETLGSSARFSGADDEFFYKVYGHVLNKDAFSIMPIIVRPKSRGRVMLKSKNPFHWPLFYANYFDDESDLNVLVEGVKMNLKPTVITLVGCDLVKFDVLQDVQDKCEMHWGFLNSKRYRFS